MIYWGLFFDNINAVKPLERVIETPHITFGFKSEPPADIVFGTTATVKVVGYGKSQDNEGYAVDLLDEVKYYNGAATPHITISVSNNGKPVDTAALDFTPCDNFMLVGKYGWYGKDGKIHF